MTRRSAKLQKKLQELESELTDLFSLPLDTTASDPRHQMSFNDIEQRFIFLNNLFSAEVASQPQTSDQLHEIGKRLAGLKAAFRDWNRSRTCAFNNQDDAHSICSDCTQALQYDNVRESGPPISEAGNFSGDKSPQKFLHSMEKDENVKREEAEEEKIWSNMGKYCGVFGCGMIVGAICMVKLFSSSDHFIQYEAFLLPPT